MSETAKNKIISKSGLTEKRLATIFPRLEKQWAGLHIKRPRLLFHYTDAHGLFGILQSKHIWATNSRFMNDPTEIAYAINLVMSVMKSRFANNKKDFLNRMLNQFLQGYEQNAKVYISCFCMQGDLLSQWRGYGATGGGYSIGFKASQLGYTFIETFDKPEPILRKVIYDRKLQEKIVGNWLQGISILEEASRKKPGSKRIKQLFNIVYGSFGYFLSECLNCFKDPAYQEEQEWRIIQFGRYGSTEVVKPSFRVAGGTVVPYTEIEIKSSKKPLGNILPIELICYGPTLNTRNTERSLNLLCEAHGYNKDILKIQRSAVPFTI